MDELPGGLKRVTMALPMRPGHVHCYLLPVEEGYLLVDTGLGLPDARELWAAELAALDGPVGTIFITHFHPDHLGAGRDVLELTGARVVEGALDAEQATRVWATPAWVEVLAEWFVRHGVPESVTGELLEQGRLVEQFVRAAPIDEVVDDGDLLHGWTLVAAPGHADGQLTLIRDGVLVAADHLLDPISPAVGLWPASRSDPLGDYLDSLRRTIELAPTISYGGHGAPITDPVARADALIEHHAERLRVAAAALTREPQTGYEVSFALFGADLGPGPRRFAVAETLAHLERLVAEGRAERHETERDGDIVGVSYTAPQ